MKVDKMKNKNSINALKCQIEISIGPEMLETCNQQMLSSVYLGDIWKLRQRNEKYFAETAAGQGSC
jgi:hypothetical protein